MEYQSNNDRDEKLKEELEMSYRNEFNNRLKNLSSEDLTHIHQQAIREACIIFISIFNTSNIPMIYQDAGKFAINPNPTNQYSIKKAHL